MKRLIYVSGAGKTSLAGLLAGHIHSTGAMG
jgi:hypothetical protein